MGFASLWVLPLSLPLMPPKVASFLVATETPDALQKFLKPPSALTVAWAVIRHALGSFLEALVQVS